MLETIHKQHKHYKHDNYSIEVVSSPSTRALGIRSIPRFSAIHMGDITCVCMGYVLFFRELRLSVEMILFFLAFFVLKTYIENLARGST